MSSHQAVKDFVDYWRGKKNFKTVPTGNCTFPAIVKYTFDSKMIEEEATAIIIRNGFQDGKVSLNEEGAFSAEVFHLDFSPDFQQFTYNKIDHPFVVEGSSSKMHGSYKVIIAPK